MQFILTDFICNNSIEDRVQKRILIEIGFWMDTGGVLHEWIDLCFNRCYCTQPMHHMVGILDSRSLDRDVNMAQFKLIIRLKKQYTVNYILKYRTNNLIIIYYYMYSRLLGTIEDIVQNFMKLMKDAGSSSQVDR